MVARYMKKATDADDLEKDFYTKGRVEFDMGGLKGAFDRRAYKRILRAYGKTKGKPQREVLERARKRLNRSGVSTEINLNDVKFTKD